MTRTFDGCFFSLMRQSRKDLSRSLRAGVALAIFAMGCGEETRREAHVPPSERTWEEPQTVEDTRLAYWVRAVSDARENVVLVWDDLEGKVRSKTYDHGSSSWSDAVLLDPKNPEDSALPSVGIDADGNVLAVWQRQSQETDERSVWSSRYDARMSTWSEATLIENSDLVLGPEVAVDAAGNGLLVFTVPGAPVASARFDGATGRWSVAEPVTPMAGFGFGPRLAMVPDGRAVALWTAGDHVSASIWAAEYDTRVGGWTRAQRVSEETTMAQATDVALSSAGSAAAVWTQQVLEEDDLEVFTVWASLRDRDGVWQEPERIDRDGGGSALAPRLAIDESGDVVCVWSADDGTQQSIWMNRYRASRPGFQGAARVDAPTRGSALAPVFRIDAHGNALALWLREAGSSRTVWGATLEASASKFAPAQELRSTLDGEASHIELMVRRDGSALALWSEAGTRLVASQLR